MQIISLREIYYDSTGIQHTKTTEKHIFASEVNANNWSSVKDKKHLNNIVIDVDSNIVIQAGGFSYERGLFCDLY